MICVDEGTIQAFLDGELSNHEVDRVTGHISVCNGCSAMVADAEREIDLAFSSLDSAYDSLVPTDRLWTKINFSIKSEAESRSIWKSVLAFLSSPSALGIASLLIVFSLFVGLYVFKNGTDSEFQVAVKNQPAVKTVNTAPNSVVSEVKDNSIQVAPVDEPKIVAADLEPEPGFRPTTMHYVKAERPLRNKMSVSVPDVSAPSNTLLAEESYVKTISTLEQEVKNQKDEALRPSARYSFERDLAVADDSIKRMKHEVKRDPNNEAARILLRTSYQNKIDLLNSLAEKSELMASLN